jgi:catechol 2,3-dioxygenase-like lactoylglutathione lyase family enzyme
MRIHHVALRTDDLARLEAFYAGLLGLAVTQRHGDRSVWLEADGTIVMLERREHGEPTPDPRSMEMLAFAVEPARARELEAALARAGHPIENQTASTLYARDPDGRRVGLSAWPARLDP